MPPVDHSSLFEKIIFLPAVILIRIISPILYIRVSPLKAARIGHLVGEMEIYLCNRKYSNSSLFTLDIFYIRKKEKISNKFIFLKIKKKVVIIPNYIGKIIFAINLKLNKIFKSKKKFFYDLQIHYSSQFLKLDNQQIKLTKSEIEKGKQMAKNLKLMPDDKYVCLVCRDSAYLKKSYPEKDYDYHSFRNANIKDFLITCNFLTDLGYKVVRIGNIVENKFETNNPKIIDYSSSKFVDDFLDVYLVSRCEFIITTATGIDEIAAVFRKPFVTVNYAPLGLLEYRPNKNFLVFKKYFCKIKKRYLTISEIFDTNGAFYAKTNDFIKNKIILTDNTPEEILEATKDCISYIQNKKINYDTKSQENFWTLYHSKRRIMRNDFYNEDLNCVINDRFLKSVDI